MKIYPTSKARNHFSDLVNQVKYQKIIIGIGRHNKCEVLMIPAPDFTQEEIPVTSFNADSPSFSFLAEEPDLYSLNDLQKRYV